jgi:outer membrane autotransporter protein
MKKQATCRPACNPLGSLSIKLNPLCNALAIAGLVLSPAIGQAQSWNPGAGAWTNAAGWNSNAVPTATDTARITNQNDRVTLNAAGVANNLELDGTLTVGAGGSLALGDSLKLGVLNVTSDPNLKIEAGGTVSATRAFVGDATGGALGKISVNGAGSSLTVAPTNATTGRFLVGGNASGSLLIENAATVTVNGTGVLHLGSTGTGTLNVGSSGVTAGSLAASSVVTGNAASAINFNHTGATTFSAAVSGAGKVTTNNGGTTTLSGNNTYTGGTTLNDTSTLVGTTSSLQGNIVANTGTTVKFNQTGGGTYAGVLSGAGALVKEGTGNVTLSGANTYTGATNINAGTLSVNGSVVSAVNVNSGGTLGGSGTVGATTIHSGGVFAPGNSIGTTTVNGGLTFAAGSVYRVEIDAAGNNDRINVVGAPGRVTINGGTVDVQASSGNYAPTTRYTIINAVGGRTGVFSGVTSNLAFLTPTLDYDTNNVYLLMARNGTSYRDVAITPNQIAFSQALQNASNGASGDMLTVINAVNNLSAVQARSAFDAMGGASLSAVRAIGPNFSASFGSRLQARLGAVASAPEEASVAYSGGLNKGAFLLAATDSVADLLASPVLSDASASGQRSAYALGVANSGNSSHQGNHGFWLRSFGLLQNTDSDGNAGATRATQTGLNAGYDFNLGNGLTVGAALTVGSSKGSFTGSLDASKSNDAGAALYMGYSTGPWNFSGSVSLTQQQIHMDRFINVGTLNRAATADFASQTLAGYGQVTYDIAMDGWTLQPSAALSISRNRSDGFTEQGAGALNLQVAAQTAHSLKSQIGAKASFNLGGLQIEPRLLWSHEFGDVNSPISAQFQGGIGAGVITPFQIAGVALSRDVGIVGLGVSGEVAKGVRFFGDLQAERSTRQRKASMLLGLRIKW